MRSKSVPFSFPTPRQNRVLPSGRIVAIPQRGTLMGNRGLLHNRQGEVRRRWNGVRWIVCVLQFKGRRRAVMSPGQYTELFFLDEATAFAAGHRPCAECQRPHFDAFRRAWRTAFGPLPRATEIDAQLHADRVGPDQSQRRFRADLADLPDGVFVHCDGDDCLVWRRELRPWTPDGYAAPRRASGEVDVLTPRSTVAVIRAGYVPGVHDTA